MQQLFRGKPIETIELKDRQIVDLPLAPSRELAAIRHFGVALDNDEAQDFLAKGWRVYGDADGPYLVIRMKANQGWPFVIDREHVDVKFNPIPWEMATRSGVICWLEHII